MEHREDEKRSAGRPKGAKKKQYTSFHPAKLVYKGKRRHKYGYGFNMEKISTKEEEDKFLQLIKDESEGKTIGGFDYDKNVPVKLSDGQFTSYLFKRNMFMRLKYKSGVGYTPVYLAKAVAEYFIAMDKNPIKTKDKHGVEIERARPMTMKSLFLWLGITERTFVNYKADNGELGLVANQAVLAIEAHQLEMGLIGEFRENLVSRILGLADKREVTSMQKKNVGIERWLDANAEEITEEGE